jgi:hypothetical protein
VLAMMSLRSVLFITFEMNREDWMGWDGMRCILMDLGIPCTNLFMAY